MYEQMAISNPPSRDGKDWQEILHGYYTVIEIANLPSVGIGDAVTTTAEMLNVRETACGNPIVSVPLGTTGTMLSGPERPPCDLDSRYTFLTWWEVLYSDGTRGWSVEDYLRKVRPSGGI